MAVVDNEIRVRVPIKTNAKEEREQTTIRLPSELKEQLQREAQERGMSFNMYLLSLIDKARRDSRK